MQEIRYQQQQQQDQNISMNNRERGMSGHGYELGYFS
jgi:hypothetical protein